MRVRLLVFWLKSVSHFLTELYGNKLFSENNKLNRKNDQVLQK